MPTPTLNAKYFPHDADAGTDEKIIYLESIFGDSGYAWYFKMIEALTRCDNFEMEWSDLKSAVMARKFNTDAETFNKFIVASTSPDVRAFVVNNGFLFSPGLKKRLNKLNEKRQKESERIAEKRRLEAEKSEKTPTNSNVAPTYTNVASTSGQNRIEENRIEEKEKKEKNAGAEFSEKEQGKGTVERLEIENEKNETSPAVAADDPEKTIRKWGAADKWDWVRVVTDEAGYDPTVTGVTVNDKVSLFCGHHAENEGYQSDPVGFFKKKFKGYLVNGKSFAPKGKKNGNHTKPKQSGAPAEYSAESVTAMFRSRYGIISENLTTQNIQKLMQAKSEAELSTWMEGFYNSLKNKSSPKRSGSESKLSDAIQKAIPP